MHLKSLVLKGFKSFADRSVMKFEPGITSIVGPNGSGKSNISDAVLWVLGERNAKNLRGQVMEDVIFAGSSARASLGIAEVDLILDNSDGTLPVEFDEVALTRRMYRNGESEYLINGAPARRMDFMDILHDTGLGMGAHSIIGQGNLDAVLTGRPQDRRILIEEAAGVLKHKQRKDRSTRKLEALDAHLARVKDVAAEMQRHLKPLERKARRAQAYRQLAEELSQLELVSAVNDLRKLQQAWNLATREEDAAQRAIQAAQHRVEQAEQAVEAAQRQAREHEARANEATLSHTRLNAAADKAASLDTLLAEKGRRIDADLKHAHSISSGNTARMTRLEKEREELQTRLHAKTESAGALQQRVDEIRQDLSGVAATRASLDAEAHEMRAAARARAEHLRQAESNLRALKDRLETHKASSAAQKIALDAARASLEEATAAHAESVAALERERAARERSEASERDIADKLHVARERLDTLVRDIEAAQHAIDRMRARKDVLDEHLRARFMRNEMAAHIAEHAGGAPSFATVLDVPEELETLVETLLGDDLTAPLLCRDDASSLVRSALAARSAGAASVLVTDATHPKPYGGEGERLVDRLGVADAYAKTLEALIGDVVLVDSFDDALRHARANDRPQRYALPDATVCLTAGKASLFRSADDAPGLLAKERECARLSTSLSDAAENLADLEATKERIKKEHARLRVQAEQAATTRAHHEGTCASLARETERLAQRVESLKASLASREDAVSSEAAALQRLQPAIGAAEAELSALQEQRGADEGRIERVQAEREHAKDEEQRLFLQRSETEARLALVEEQARSIERELSQQERDLQAMARSRDRAKSDIARLTCAKTRLESLRGIMEDLRRSARAKAEELEHAAGRTRRAADELAGACETARAAATDAHRALEASRTQAAEAQVEKGKLETQVEFAVSTIVETCGVPLETALDTPAPDDEASLKERIGELRGRLSAMGTIDSSAAEEYAEAKDRYDFMASQIEDVEAARRALQRIITAIDARIQERFDQTFEQVNENFRTIFAQLFPGGTGWLELAPVEGGDQLGLEVHAQPRGKKISKMTLMSGGERSLTAIALLFAVYGIRRTPFYILDEVEAALDDSNLRRLLAYLDGLRNETQLIMVTHQRRTMELSDVLYGVSMQADGVTKVVSQKLERNASPSS